MSIESCPLSQMQTQVSVYIHNLLQSSFIRLACKEAQPEAHSNQHIQGSSNTYKSAVTPTD